ncbi:MAG: YdcF family protein [Lewinellaceae bacterium]|nr:YdcF family protein [Lewinellaceae bacterium]
MFFFLSKLLQFLIKPITWVLLLLVYAWLGKRPLRKRRALTAAIALLFLFSNQMVFNLAVRAWEPDLLTAGEITEPYDIGILLGGFSNPNIEPGADRFNVNDRANRFVNALELYRTGKVRRLLVTGGNGRLLQDGPLEASEARQFLLRLGIPDSDILIEPESRNTFENALFTRQLLDERYPNARCLLLTSAWHMRRAQACFEKAGLAVVPFPVDYLSERWQFTPEKLLAPNARTLSLWELLIKEWVGYVAYGVRGYL